MDGQEVVINSRNLSSVEARILPDLVPVICRTMSDIKTCMRIRYDEYCLKRGWEASSNFPDGLETDEYDDRAVHILLTDRATSQPVGTVRILYSDLGKDSDSLPCFDWSPDFEKHIRGRWSTGIVMELSRCTISREHLKRSAEKVGLSQAIFPMIALMKGVLHASAFDDVRASIMTAAPSLKRLLAKAGFHYHDVGIRIDHRGIRAPIYREMPPLLAELYDVNTDVWRYVTENGVIWPLNRTSLESERANLPV